MAFTIVNQRWGETFDRLATKARERGYKTHLGPEGADKGIELLSAPGPFGFGTPRICVQVKSGDAPVDSPTLNQLICLCH
jgi:restriction system protein